MALDDTQRALVFEVFDFPPNAEVKEMWGPIGRANAVQVYSFRSPSEAIDQLLVILATTPAEEALVAALLVEWVKVRINEQELSKAEDVSGVVVSSSEKRRLIRHRMQNYIPLYLEGEIEAKQDNILSDARGGGSRRGGRIMRG